MITFDTVVLGAENGSFDTVSNTFTVPQSLSMYCLYWMNIGVHINGNSQVDLRVTNSSLTIIQSSAYIDEGITSRAGVVKLKAGSVVSLTTRHPVSGAYWSTFRLDTLMSPLVAFHVGRTSSQNFTGKIVYDSVTINEGNAWEYLNSRLKVPYSGIYCLTISVGLTANNNPLLALHVNGNERQKVGEVGLTQLFTAGTDLMSTTHFVQLTAGDVVKTVFSLQKPIFNQQAIYSDSESMATSFSGFFYNPVSNIQVGIRQRQ